MSTMSLSPLFRRSIGFDRLNDLFEYAMHNDVPSYPPYNVEKHGDNDYRIVVAAAGFNEQELAIDVENRVLTISGGRDSEGENSDQEPMTYLHRGIAKRSFRLAFRLDENIEIRGARFENGLLMIDLLRVVPEQQRARRIPINGDETQSLSDQSSSLSGSQTGVSRNEAEVTA
ncbi:Hsp20 family protein [Kushneria phosphatilytica]|uniref:Hsp20 family protein n=1 Tax=Kushneria phosphatilytica TaxID=657387 RepID=A0A1S1NT73_9GAMM|nr:Hsp20 family protein [Kushneria phosphatilytica]OHV08785.1 heat-shock protein [Kushneria phosphatilytica]QEL12505.1 Hsp20 family protein [Kushneria phosphatilytica]